MVKFSFIIPVYGTFTDNNLKHCIDFLVNQTFKDFEIIICGNKIIDTDYILYNGIKINNILVPTDRIGKLMNEGFKVSHGEYIHLWSLDLIVYPDYLERLSEYIEKYGNDKLYAGKLMMINSLETRKNFEEFYFKSYDLPEGFCCFNRKYFINFREEFKGCATHWCQEFLWRMWKHIKFICMRDVEVVHIPHFPRISSEDALISSQKSWQLFQEIKK